MLIDLLPPRGYDKTSASHRAMLIYLRGRARGVRNALFYCATDISFGVIVRARKLRGRVAALGRILIGVLTDAEGWLEMPFQRDVGFFMAGKRANGSRKRSHNPWAFATSKGLQTRCRREGRNKLSS